MINELSHTQLELHATRCLVGAAKPVIYLPRLKVNCRHPACYYPLLFAHTALKRDWWGNHRHTFKEMHRDMQIMYIKAGVAAARRILGEVPVGIDPRMVDAKLLKLHRKELE
jgi:hypothetical protein